jgi:hypothetical protein
MDSSMSLPLRLIQVAFAYKVHSTLFYSFHTHNSSKMYVLLSSFSIFRSCRGMCADQDVLSVYMMMMNLLSLQRSLRQRISART